MFISLVAPAGIHWKDGWGLPGLTKGGLGAYFSQVSSMKCLAVFYTKVLLEVLQESLVVVLY